MRDVLARRRSVEESTGAYMSPLEFQSMMVSAGSQENASQSRRAASSSRRLLERITAGDANAIPDILATDSIRQMKEVMSPKSRVEGDDGVIYVIENKDDRESTILAAGEQGNEGLNVSTVVCEPSALLAMVIFFNVYLFEITY